MLLLHKWKREYEITWQKSHIFQYYCQRLKLEIKWYSYENIKHAENRLKKVDLYHLCRVLKTWKSYSHNLYLYIFLTSKNLLQSMGIKVELLTSLFKNKPQNRVCTKNKRKLFFDQLQSWKGRGHFSWWMSYAVGLEI